MNTPTLAEIASTSPAAVRTLERYGLDYCCGGRQPFAEACATKGLDPESVLKEVGQALGVVAADRDWRTAPLDEIVDHIVATHHEYLKLELPALSNRMAKVLAVHGSKDPTTLSTLADVLGGLRSELEMHLQKEEMMLFPFLRQYGRAEAQGRALPPVPFGSVANPIAVMEREHGGAGNALAEIRTLTNDYQYPAYACSTVRALFDGLKAMEADLHVHIHLENNILFPRAIALERR
jgi:regulator of cell morphogenesis and NO signaling